MADNQKLISDIQDKVVQKIEERKKWYDDNRHQLIQNILKQEADHFLFELNLVLMELRFTGEIKNEKHG